MSRVLFVSGDPATAALHEALRLGAGRWQVSFVSGRAQALAAMTEGVYEVVIADLAPDPSECVELMAHVRREQPETARIVLSQAVEPALLARALEVAHQCVPKPLEPVQLWKVVERTCCLHGLMNNRVIRSLLGGLDRLPSVPRSYVALTQAMARPEVSLGEIAAIVERDTAMATKVLQLVNSAFFGRPRRISSIPVTVSLLGLERLKALALSTHVFGMLSDADSKRYGVEKLQERSLLTAQLARRFLAASGRAEEGFTVGLLEDVGRLLLAACLKERYRDVVEEAWERQTRIDVVERERFNVSHAVVGACLLSVWGLPVTIIEAVAFHHSPSGVLHDETALVDAVHVADALADPIMAGRTPSRRDLVLDPILVARDGMEERIDAWCRIAIDETSAIRP